MIRVIKIIGMMITTLLGKTRTTTLKQEDIKKKKMVAYVKNTN